MLTNLPLIRSEDWPHGERQISRESQGHCSCLCAHAGMQKGWEGECEESGLAGHAVDGWLLQPHSTLLGCTYNSLCAAPARRQVPIY